MTNEWIEANNKLEKTFEFKDFKEALVFVNRVGEIAERMQHHPDIGIKDYKKVIVSTTTHDGGSMVTTKDQELTAEIDQINVS